MSAGPRSSDDPRRKNAAIIRPAGPGDLPVVVTIFQRARSEMAYLPKLHSAEEDEHFVSGLIAEGIVRVIELEGRIAAFAAAHDGWLDHLYCSPEFQNRGLGKELLDEAKHANRDGLRLWVFEANVGAARFYEREGFVLQQQRTAHEADNEEHLADRLYVWSPGVASKR